MNYLTSTTSTQVNFAPIVVFDGSFDGWLSAVFAIYQNGWQHRDELAIRATHDYVPSLWQPMIEVTTHTEHSERVQSKLENLFGKQGMRLLLWAFLSEAPEVYRQLFGVVRYQLAHPMTAVWQDYSHADVLAINQWTQKVGRERHRMQAFVRFEHTEQGVYFARIEPDFNVLPIAQAHFADRFADQSWAIYDVRRGYGVFYECDPMINPTGELQLITDVDDAALTAPHTLHSAAEREYQLLWQKYFRHVTIAERRNPKLHVQYLPRRYWKYLTEKQSLKPSKS